MHLVKRAAFLLLASLAFASSLPAAEKPNIVFLFADDQRADTIGATGIPISTPQISTAFRPRASASAETTAQVPSVERSVSPAAPCS